MTDPLLDQTWVDGEDGGTPLSAQRLTELVDAINAGIAATNTLRVFANSADNAASNAYNNASVAGDAALAAQASVDALTIRVAALEPPT